MKNEGQQKVGSSKKNHHRFESETNGEGNPLTACTNSCRRVILDTSSVLLLPIMEKSPDKPSSGQKRKKPSASAAVPSPTSGDRENYFHKASKKLSQSSPGSSLGYDPVDELAQGMYFVLDKIVVGLFERNISRHNVLSQSNTIHFMFYVPSHVPSVFLYSCSPNRRPPVRHHPSKSTQKGFPQPVSRIVAESDVIQTQTPAAQKCTG